MENKLWVLKKDIGTLSIYITPDGSHSTSQKDAIKFESELSAERHLMQCKNFMEFIAVEEEIIEMKNKYLHD